MARICWMEVLANHSSGMAGCMSEAIAWKDFLQTSGKWPPSLTMPPSWPPMPTAQVLQAFLLRMARHIRSGPTRAATLNV